MLSATKLLAVLTGNTDATGSAETPHKRRPNPLREATRHHGYQAERPGLIFIPHAGVQPPWQLLAPGNYASAKLRVMDGSTGMPGPVVVDTVTFFR